MRPVLFLLLLATALPAAGAQEPNFAGLWEMNREQSDFGGVPGPDSITYVIWHYGAKLTFDHIQDGTKTRVEITIDGQERVTSREHDNEVWTRAYWKGAELVLEARQRPRFGQVIRGVKWTSRWSLDAAGNRLIIRRQIVGDDAQVEQTIVLDRAAKPKS